ncbi:M28 family peptidase, partial [Sphingosinicella sp.]|uniref:M28 family peptidase n=1 Tax=Sphingosinicella sp. TaxID=1917971 RepID=UPI0040375F54
HISGALKSHARDERVRLLVERGAVGLIAIATTHQAEAPWARTAPVYSRQPGMYFTDPALRDPGPLLGGTVSPATAERLFARSGRSYADIAAAADASRPVPGFALGQSLRATIAIEGRSLSSANVVARLPGRDPTLAAEHVVLTAHLDGLGVGTQPGDAIHNGTLDNAAGVASLLDIAARYRRTRARPRRSILFVALTGEERGLLGSRYFSRRPSVPRESIVANLNYDMALPIYPLTGVTVLGAEESSLGEDARAVSEWRGLPLLPDPFPNRNAFTRSDQYSFIEQGIPALAFKFGFAPNSPEAAAEAAWRATRYHMPSDDPAQPVRREDSIRLNDFIAALALRVANAEGRPRWNDDSFFRRFARPQERTP